jgi:hypothetical protein
MRNRVNTIGDGAVLGKRKMPGSKPPLLDAKTCLSINDIRSDAVNVAGEEGPFSKKSLAIAVGRW